jgi:hypothetical protein
VKFWPKLRARRHNAKTQVVFWFGIARSYPAVNVFQPANAPARTLLHGHSVELHKHPRSTTLTAVVLQNQGAKDGTKLLARQRKTTGRASPDSKTKGVEPIASAW